MAAAETDKGISSASNLVSDATDADEDDFVSPLQPGVSNAYQTAFYFGEPGTKIEPYGLKHDPTVKWAYQPGTLSVAAIGALVVAALAYNSETIFPRQIRQHLGLISGVSVFLLFCMLNFRDGPFRRPHPAFWRIILGLNLLYVMILCYLFFQDAATARRLVRYFDSSLGAALPEKSYAENCDFTPQNVWNGIDIFCLAHSLGWFGKAVILRDHWFCWILSVGFEVMEYSLAYQLPNFEECWWDHWILDVLLCNWFGLWLGMKTCEWLKVSPFSWRGLRPVGRARSAARTLTPYDWTEFKWEGTKTFRNYVSTVCLLTAFLASEVNVFYLKTLLWIAPEHPLVTIRLAAIFLWALPAVREFFEYVTYKKRVKRMGSHVWLLITTIILELLIIVKWSTGQFPNPAPYSIKVLWTFIITGLITYPTIKFGIPELRRRRQGVKGRKSGGGRSVAVAAAEKTKVR